MIERYLVVTGRIRQELAVRNIYTFQFDWERLERLVTRLLPVFIQVRGDLEAFASFLEQVAK